jgi:hypothetical protein
MGMGEREAETTREFGRIVVVLAELTGLPSNWSGRLELVPGAEFKGRKPFSCDVYVDEALAGLPQRWSTLIHEALHTLSAGYAPADYRSFPGWEEGVVEQLQRLLRPTVLGRMGVEVDAALFEQDEAQHFYNAYIEALESLRTFLGSPATSFYIDLLGTLIRERPGFVLRIGNQRGGKRRSEFVRRFSVADAVLKGALRQGFPSTGVEV